MGKIFFDCLKISLKNCNPGTCIVFNRSHWSHGHNYTVGPVSNYLREGMDEGFNWFWFNLNRFCGGAPGGGPGGSIDARGRFLGACLFGITRGNNFFAIRSRGFRFGLTSFELEDSFATRFFYTCFFVFFYAFSCASFKRTCVPATLVASRAFKLFIRHLFKQSKTWSRKHSSKEKLTRLLHA